MKQIKKAIIPRSMEELDEELENYGNVISVIPIKKVIHFINENDEKRTNVLMDCTIVLFRSDYKNYSFANFLVNLFRKEVDFRRRNNFKKLVENMWEYSLIPFGYTFKLPTDKPDSCYAVRVAKERLIHSLKEFDKLVDLL